MKKHSIVILAAAVIVTGLACGSLPNITSQATPTEVIDTSTAAAGQESSTLPAARIVNDEGGPATLRGEVPYTNPFFNVGVAQPLVILEDQAGFVDRDRGYVMPVESQTLGQITSDFFTSPFTYSLALPIEPQGGLRDVHFNGIDETGVMVFAVAYWNNTFGDPFLEERDLSGGGWSTAYASTRVSEDAENRYEIIGGKLIVYAPDDRQAFPAGFGDDGLLFTEDDPMINLPQGYTLVDLDSDPFTFDRSREPVIDLIEPEGTALDDFSGMTYTEAFDAMIEKLRNEYAFTEYKNINWDALSGEFRPLVEEAQRRRDAEAYRRVLSQLLWRIPDGHVSGPFVRSDFQQQVGGGIGLAIRELSDGRVLAVYVQPGGPAERAGIRLRAEISEINGIAVTRAISQATPWLGPFSTEHNRRLDQMRFATRFPVGSAIQVTYQNPGDPRPQTASMTSVAEIESLLAVWPGADRTGFELPVEYRMLDSGYAYVKITSFFDNDYLTVQLWERLMGALNENAVSGLIIDLRDNGGGRGFLADQMAAYFFDEPLVLGNTGYYNKSLGEFYFDPATEEKFILPAEDLRYRGRIVVLISQDCASACEFFAYALTLQQRGHIIGHYPTAGLGGSIEEFAMPEDETIRFTIGRAVDANGEIHIEGKGVPPDTLVPLTEEALFGDRDTLLEAAVSYLNSRP